ncbi:MAG: ABC transporter ATP-binding protein [Alphaproteobacteria bacterium]|nr:ABC transporter ATP-binding protein [Alphaproteobacteria bacterium]
MIEVDALVKVYPGHPPVRAVDGVSFEARRGEVFGLLGANGAGKTTTLRMLVTLLSPDGGTARVNGHDVRTAPEAVRGSVGYLSVTTGLYERLTPREMLVSFGRMQQIADPVGRAEQLIARFGIGAFADQRCGRLSTGMKQKVSIARALVHDPPVLILDEPTVGLDVLVAQTFLEFVETAREEGRAVLYSTHIMSEVERLCDRVAIIHEGRIVAATSVAALVAEHGTVEKGFVATVNGA